MHSKNFGAYAGALLAAAVLAYVWLAPAGVTPAPDITLQTIEGKGLRLSDLRGRPVLVNFWATTCPGCVKEMPELAELYRQLGPRGLEVIGIAMSYDPPNQVIALSKARAIPYTLAFDLQGEAARAFGNVRLTPTSFLISPTGVITLQQIGELNMPRLHGLIEPMLPSPAAAPGVAHDLG